MSDKKLSTKITGLKFMQRAAEREKAVTVAVEEEKVKDASHWVVNSPAGKAPKWNVVHDGDPRPALSYGRVSVGAFNPATEKLMAQAETSLAERRAAAARAAAAPEAAVSDAEMARVAAVNRAGGVKREREEVAGAGAGADAGARAGVAADAGEGGSEAYPDIVPLAKDDDEEEDLPRGRGGGGRGRGGDRKRQNTGAGGSPAHQGRGGGSRGGWGGGRN